MGYFSNNTEGDAYWMKYCSKCAHERTGGEIVNCPIWTAHMLWAGDECDKPDSILHKMIPRTKDSLGNEKCIFYQGKEI